MSIPNPPRWLERGLLHLLPTRDRETVSGDLAEIYAERYAKLSVEAKRSWNGPLRANLWYLRQVASFVPRAIVSMPMRRLVLALLCGFTALSGTWLGAMAIVLRHARLDQQLIATTIVAQALLTLFALRAQRIGILRPSAILGSFAILWLAGKAFLGVLRAADMEGYIVLIALALVLQAVLTWFTLPQRAQPHLQP